VNSDIHPVSQYPVPHVPFNVQRSTFPVQCSPFNVPRSTFNVPRLRSAARDGSFQREAGIRIVFPGHSPADGNNRYRAGLRRYSTAVNVVHPSRLPRQAARYVSPTRRGYRAGMYTRSERRTFCVRSPMRSVRTFAAIPGRYSHQGRLSYRAGRTGSRYSRRRSAPSSSSPG